METTIQNTQEKGKCISKLIYWSNMHHKKEIKWKHFKKHSDWNSGQTLNISWKVVVSYVKTIKKDQPFYWIQKIQLLESSKILIEKEPVLK